MLHHFIYQPVPIFSWLQTLANFAQVVTIFSVLVAVYEYRRRGKQDKNLATIDQISFFRETIIPKWTEIIKKIKSKDKKFWFSRIRVDSQDIQEIKKGQDRNFDNQVSIFFDASKLESGEFVDNDILDELIFLLNMLEEFALKVKHLETEDHPALASLHFTFIQVVEQNVAALFFMRNVVVGNPIYSATLSLYDSWKDKSQKPNIIKNLAKYGFITKEQQDDFYRKKREGTQNYN